MQNYKMVMFDFDDTLAPLYGKMSGKTEYSLELLSKLGLEVAISTGKPCFYAAGLIKHLNIDDIIIIGENGVHIQIGKRLPPKNEYVLGYTDETVDLIRELKKEIISEIGDKIWIQPTLYQLAIFYKDISNKVEINRHLEDKISGWGNLEMKKHYDAVDVGVKINKGTALKEVCKLYKISTEEVITVGNASNDYPMFDLSGESIGINLEDKSKAKINVSCIDGAFEEVFKLLGV